MMRLIVRKVWRVAVLALALTVGIAACSSDPGAGPTTTAADATTTTQGGSEGTTTTAATDGPSRGGNLRVLLSEDAGQGFDPAILTFTSGHIVTSVVFESLLTLDESGAPAALLAESWNAIDELTYEFTLREGVKFHNGDPLTADDVVFTLERLRNPEISPRAGVFANVDSVEASGERTVTIKLSAPYAPLLSVLADVTSGIVSKRAVEESDGNFHAAPVGTGAFSLDNWVPGEIVELVAFADYWQADLPYLDGVTFTFNSDSNARTASLRAGDVDMLVDGPEVMLPILDGDESIDVFAPQGQTNFLYWLLNINKAPFDDIKVRQGIYEAIDRTQLAEACRAELSSVLNAGFLPTNYWAANNETMYTGDLDKARALFAEAGFEGADFSVNVLTGWDWQLCTALVIQEQLKPLGINLEIRIMDVAQFVAERSVEDMSSDAAMDSAIAGFTGTIDPDERFQPSFVTGGRTNYVKFSDAEVDRLAGVGQSTPDIDQRAAAYRDAQSQLAEVGPMAFLYNYHKYDAVRAEVEDYRYDPFRVSYRQLAEVWLDK